MRKVIVLMSASMLVLGCSSRTVSVVQPQERSGSVVTTPEKEKTSAKSQKGSGNAKANVRGPRKLNGVPPGHYPPKGMCRVWYEGRPPGKQPAPVKCSSLRGKVPSDAFVLYNDAYYDAQYKYDEKSVPKAIAEILLRR